MNELYVLLGAEEKALTDAIGQLFSGDKVIHHQGKLDPKSAKSTEEHPQVLTLCGDPRQTLEALPAQLNHCGLSLARIIALVELPVVEKRPELQAYLQFLAHFCDVLLIVGAVQAPSFLNALRKTFKDRPMLIARLPEDLSKLSEILYPEARRLTQYFEDQDAAELAIDWGQEDAEGENEASNHSSKKSPKKNLHKKKKTNVNQVDLEALEAPVSEPYFARDAVGSYKLKFPTP